MHNESNCKLHNTAGFENMNFWSVHTFWSRPSLIASMPSPRLTYGTTTLPHAIKVRIRFCGIFVSMRSPMRLEAFKAETACWIPSMLDTVEVRRSSRSVHSFDCFMFQASVSDMCMVGTGIIVHQNKVRTNTTSLSLHKRIKNLLTVSHSRQHSIFNHIQVSFFFH